MHDPERNPADRPAPASPGGFPVRLFLTLFIPVALLILGGAWYVAQDRIKGELSLIRSAEINSVIAGVRNLDDGLQAPLDHVRWLATQPAVQRALAGGDGAMAELAGIFTTLITGNTAYDHLRWIDATGMELLRIGRNGDLVARVADAELQNQAERYYFRAAMQVAPGQVYVSPLDLNVEHGQVEEPFRPMLRLATPVADGSGRSRGILILNIAAAKLLDDFVTSVGEARDHAMLLDPQGYWLRSPISADEWGFMFSRTTTLGSRSPKAWEAITRIPSGQEELADGLWTWSTVYPLKVEAEATVPDIPSWLVATHLPANRLALVRADAWKAVIAVAALVMAVFALLAAKLALAMVGRNCAEVAAAKAHAAAEAAQRLCEAQERFHMVVEANANGLLVVDTDARIVMANPALERMFGYAKDELLGRPLEVLLPEADRARHRDHFAAYLRAPTAKPMGAGRDLHGQRKDGSVFPVEISLSPFTDNGRQFVDAIVADISERKRMENLHLASEARLQLLVKNNPNGMLVVDSHGRIVLANPALETMFGYHRDELLGQPMDVLLPEGANTRHGAMVTTYMRDPVAKPMGSGRDLHGRRKDGSVFPVEISLSAFTENGQQYVDAIIADISERKRIETLHQQSEARMQLLNPNGLLLIDDQGHIQLANPALERMFGYEHGELLDQPVETLVPEDATELHRELRSQYLDAPADRPMGAGREILGRRRDGSRFPIEVILSSGTDNGRRYVQATVLDKTMRG